MGADGGLVVRVRPARQFGRHPLTVELASWAMLAEVVDCSCTTPVGWLILAGVAGSGLYDVATNFYVWQRGDCPTG